MIVDRTKMLCSLVILAIFCVVSPAVGLGICDEATNLTANCDFATDIGEWTQGYGQGFIHSTDGHFSSGSMEATSSPIMGEELSFSHCIELGSVPPTTHGGGAWMKMVSGTLMNCNVSVTEYASDSCTIWVDYHSTSLQPVGPDWTWAGVSFTADASTLNFRVAVVCYGETGSYTMRFDDVYLGEGLAPPIFTDGFETGDTTAWSSTVGGP